MVSKRVEVCIWTGLAYSDYFFNTFFFHSDHYNANHALTSGEAMWRLGGTVKEHQAAEQ